MERTRAKNGHAAASQSFLVAQSFHLGPLNIRFYSITMVSAIVIGYLIGRLQLNKLRFPELVPQNISKETFFDDLVFWTIISSFLGARVYHVLTHFEDYRYDLWSVFKIWEGGLAIYGSVIVGALTLFYFARKYGIRFLKLTDLVALAMPVSQAMGRVGNYFNYEAFGDPTNLPWKMFVPERFRPMGFEHRVYFHPTFFYEIIWNLLLFVVLLVYAKNKLWGQSRVRYGVLTAIYLAGYGLGRFFIEGLRLDSGYVGMFKVNQLISVLLIIVSLGIIYRYAPQTDQ